MLHATFWVAREQSCMLGLRLNARFAERSGRDQLSYVSPTAGLLASSVAAAQSSGAQRIRTRARLVAMARSGVVNGEAIAPIRYRLGLLSTRALLGHSLVGAARLLAVGASCTGQLITLQPRTSGSSQSVAVTWHPIILFATRRTGGGPLIFSES